MMDMLNDIVYWHWFVLAGFMLLIEMIAPAAIFLWPGAAAALIGIVCLIVPSLPWTVSVPLWGILSVAAAYGWRLYRQKNPAKVDPGASTLNRRGSEYIGRTLTLSEPVQNGVGQVKVGETIWKVVSNADYAAGAQVKVTGVEGTSLRVEAV